MGVIIDIPDDADGIRLPVHRARTISVKCVGRDGHVTTRILNITGKQKVSLV